MSDIVPQLMGYMASVLLAISLLVNNDLRFRWLNTFGCLCFIVYGILINAFPIILTNAILLLINVFYLVKIYRTKENFDLVEFKPGDKLIEKFLKFHQTDIRSYFPDFNFSEMENSISFVVLRDMVIANIFVAKVSSPGNAIVDINYTVPKYRDYKVGKYIFDKEKSFILSKGVNVLVYKKVYNNQHKGFLKTMGFIEEYFDGAPGMVKRLV